MSIISIAIGGAAGSLCRYGMSNGIYFLLGRSFPYGTLAVNILGSFIMGSVYILMIERASVSEELRAGVTIGLLGAFTTFSTFSIETLRGLFCFLKSSVVSLSTLWIEYTIKRQAPKIASLILI